MASPFILYNTPLLHMRSPVLFQRAVLDMPLLLCPLTVMDRVLRCGFPEKQKRLRRGGQVVESSPKVLRFCLLVALICALLAALNLILGMSEFGGYDLSSVIDAAWRIDLGQIPNVSFICTLPPSLYLSTDWAFKLFGVRWVSLLYAEDILYLFLCFLGLRLCWVLRTYRPDREVVSLMWMYVGIQSILLLSVNHIYHSTTSAGLDAFAVLATYVLLSSTRDHHRWESAAYLAIGFMILLAS